MKSAVLIALVLTGCQESATTVRIALSSTPGLDVASLTLEIVVLATSSTQTVAIPPDGGRPKLPGTLRVILPDVVSQVIFTFQGFDSAGKPLPPYQATTVSRVHAEVPLSVQLGKTTPLVDLGGIDLHNPTDMSTSSVWSIKTSGPVTTFSSVMGSSNGEVYAAGDNGKLFRTIDQGTTWTLVKTPAVSEDFHAVWTSGDQIFVVGQRGVVLVSSDHGVSWQQSLAPVGTSAALYGLWGSSPNDLYAVGEDSSGIILHSTDLAVSWVPMALPAGTKELYAIGGSGATDVYVVGTDGAVFRFQGAANDGGLVFEPLKPGIAADLRAVYVKGPGDLYVAGGGGELRHSTDHGSTFAQIETKVSQVIYGMWGAGTRLYLVGYSGLILTSGDSGGTFTKETPIPRHLYSVWGTGAGDVYAVGYAGTLIHRVE